MEEIHLVFMQEARDQIAALEVGLMRLERGERDSETIDAIFRAAHTVKGGAGVVEMTAVESFTHTLENVLEKVRSGEIDLTPKLISLLLECCDHLSRMFDDIENGGDGDSQEHHLHSENLAVQINGLSEGGGLTGVTTSMPKETSAPVLEASGGGNVGADTWHISVRFGQGVLKNGMDPLAFLRYLLMLGEITHITTLFDAMPAAAEMDPEACYLGFEINLRSSASKSEIEGVFEFVRDACELHILPPCSRIRDFIKLIEELPEENMRLGEILVKSGVVTQDELENALRDQRAAQAEPRAEGQTPPFLGEILIHQQSVQPELVEAAVVKQKQVCEKKVTEASLIRVQADKLDQLIDLVGELVIAGASANLIAHRTRQTELIEATSLLSRLVEDIRDSALQLRMVQIGETFNRFNRVVRDLSKEIGKEIELFINGGETELDKSVVEKISDPLMHLMRNAMDHGIEATEERLAAGKSAKGRVELNAYHDSGSVVIEISDDGGGLSHDKILKKAIERGVVQPGATLNEQEITNLIFDAGFSTAEQISSLSGRGVGLDVVKKNIQALRGSVDVSSQPGQGTRFTIRLPLTLAIIDGFLVGIDKASFVIPLDTVVECLELKEQAVDRHYLNLRGEVLPFVRLRELFEVESKPPQRENVVVIRAGGHKAGVVVDQLLGEFQTVIKPLASLFRNLRGIGGSTILGSGEVALILDVQALTHMAGRRETESFSMASVAR
ncbi:MAG: chemotaxis protein CheA [Proteobacteria bacterium]|nr:chemotaxis protein CheA [Pseudomonadota bacterium]